MPVISVILPVFNSEKYLHKALASITAQSYRDFEVIAIDDGSSDNSLRILKSFANVDPRIKVISRANTGIVGALEEARRQSQGEYIARMDSDDVAMPCRFERQLSVLQSRDEIVAVGSSVEFIDEDGNVVEKCSRAVQSREIAAALLNGDGGALIHPSVMFRTASVEKVGGYRSRCQYVEDLDLFLRLELIGSLTNCPEVLLQYRIHSTSINFRRIRGRNKTKREVLLEASKRRGFHTRNPSVSKTDSIFTNNGMKHRKWAVTALMANTRYVAVTHGWEAVRFAPLNVNAWRSLRYALAAGKPSQAND